MVAGAVQQSDARPVQERKRGTVEQYNASGLSSEERAERLQWALARKEDAKDRLERRIEVLHEQIYVLVERLCVADQAWLEQDPAVAELWRIWKIGRRRARRAGKERHEEVE
jgi:hypothetical protein